MNMSYIMNNKSMSRVAKYTHSEKRLNEGWSFDEIAEELEITVGSLYTLRSEVKSKLKGKDGFNKAIRLISFENLKDHLGDNPNTNRNEYLLNEITRTGKPLRSNTLLIIGAIRDMLRSK